MDLTKLGAREAAALIVEGRLTAVGLTEACLERSCDRWDPTQAMTLNPGIGCCPTAAPRWPGAERPCFPA